MFLRMLLLWFVFQAAQSFAEEIEPRRAYRLDSRLSNCSFYRFRKEDIRPYESAESAKTIDTLKHMTAIQSALAKTMVAP